MEEEEGTSVAGGTTGVVREQEEIFEDEGRRISKSNKAGGQECRRVRQWCSRIECGSR